MTDKAVDYRQFIHSPVRAVSTAVQEFERRKNSLYRLTWGVKSWDDYLIPMMDGDLISLLARPGHTKTSSLIHLAKQGTKACHALADQGTGFNKIVVYATWETTVEEFIGLLSAQESGQTLEDIARGRADIDRIRDVAIGNIGNRIYIIGKSLSKRSYTPITMGIVDYLLRDLQDEGKEPMVLLLDYLQAIPAMERGMSKRETVEHNAMYAKDLGLNHGCPVAMGVQASRDVDAQSGLKFPTMSDAQWSSIIEQVTDKLMGLTRPAAYMTDPEDNITHKGATIPVTSNLLGMKVIKQRWGPAGKTFLSYFNPATISLADLTSEEHVGF